MSGESRGFVAALDIGTTTLRCHIIDDQGATVGIANSNIKLLYPDNNQVEIDPDELWSGIIDVIKRAVVDADVSFGRIKSLGISTQRSTFITWSKGNFKPFHNFVTWKDLRTTDLVKEVNKSWKMVGLRTICYVGYILTGLGKLRMVSQLRFSSLHVTVRLLWILRNNEAVQRALKDNDVSFGTMETWLVAKLTGGTTYVSDISNASVTGMFDPTALGWSFIPKLLGIPTTLLPPVADNDCKFGDTLEEIFGVSIPIGSVMADQSASMYGSCSFKKNDLKLTLGTGAFMNVNTGERIHACLDGMYPLVGWKVKNRLTYALEISCSDAGSLVQWMLNAGLIGDPAESGSLACKVADNGGVYFIPAFSGLGPPIKNETAASGFIGVTPKTSREHLVRAVLESIAFRVAMAYHMLRKERAFVFQSIKVDGGVSKNDFVCQMVADLTDLNVERLSAEMSVLGAAYVAGLSCGMWSSEAKLTGMIKIERTFEPTDNTQYKKSVDRSLHQWQRATERFSSWYDHT